MSLFEGLNVATRGLAASQLGINVTGQNITNAFTEGYSRKRIEQNAEWRRDGSFGQMGFGVEVYAINRVRDQFIDRLVNEESTRFGYYSIKDSAYDRVESVFNEPSEHALNSLLNDFWNGWADVHNNPDSAGARETLRSTAQTMVGQFHYITTQLRSYKDTINDEIESRVNRINELTAGIHRCNIVIAGTEASLNNKANDTRDQRDAMLQELAKLVDVDYFEDDRGILNVSSNGHMLVSGAKNHELLIKRQEITEEDGYQYARIDIIHELTGNGFIPKNGELKALIEVRDTDIPRYENYINNIAKTLVTEVNKIHQNGYALSGLTFIDFFDSDPSKINAANIDIAQAIKHDINNIAAGTGGKTMTADRLQYTLVEDTSIIPSIPPKPPVSEPISLGNADPSYRYLFKNSFDIEVIDTTTVPPTNRKLQEGKDYTIDYNNATVTFMDNATSDAVANGWDVLISFKYHESAFGGPGDGDNALLISQLRDTAVMQSDLFGKETQTINQFYSGMLGRLGVERNDAAAGLGVRTDALNQLLTRQDQITGVNLDEEMANLIQYQHTYQASARYLTTINTMLETLLNM